VCVCVCVCVCICMCPSVCACAYACACACACAFACAPACACGCVRVRMRVGSDGCVCEVWGIFWEGDLTADLAGVVCCTGAALLAWQTITPTAVVDAMDSLKLPKALTQAVAEQLFSIELLDMPQLLAALRNAGVDATDAVRIRGLVVSAARHRVCVCVRALTRACVFVPMGAHVCSVYAESWVHACPPPPTSFFRAFCLSRVFLHRHHSIPTVRVLCCPCTRGLLQPLSLSLTHTLNANRLSAVPLVLPLAPCPPAGLHPLLQVQPGRGLTPTPPADPGPEAAPTSTPALAPPAPLAA
jgi:hypothetical protein